MSIASDRHGLATIPTEDSRDGPEGFIGNAKSANSLETDRGSNTPPDPFDPASLRLTGDMTAALGVSKALITVPVKKPEKSWFVRVHPDPNYQVATAVLELKEERETYLVAPALRSALAGESMFQPRSLHTAVNRQGVVFLWPLRIAGQDGKVDEWSRSAIEAAKLAQDSWVRVQGNRA